VEPYDTPQAPVLADFTRTDEFSSREAAVDIRHELSPSREQVKVGGPADVIGQKTGLIARRRLDKSWEDLLTRTGPQQVRRPGVWIHGDGKGQLLNLQLANRPSIAGPRRALCCLLSCNWRQWGTLLLCVRLVSPVLSATSGENRDMDLSRSAVTIRKQFRTLSSAWTWGIDCGC